MRMFFLFFWLIRDSHFGGEENSDGGSGVLKSAPSHLHRVNNPRFKHICDEGISERVIARVRLTLEHFVEDDPIFFPSISSNLSQWFLERLNYCHVSSGELCGFSILMRHFSFL